MSAPRRETTVRRVLTRHARTLGGPEAARVVAHGLGVARERLYVDAARALSVRERRAVARLVARRRSGTPLSYLTGEVGFGELTFRVGPGTLVPRPETEILVERAVLWLAGWHGERAPLVADLGTGSGAVGLSVARRVPGARVVLADLSPRALAYARRNAARLAPSTQVLPAGDLTGPLERAGLVADLVLMNPPYLDRRSMRRRARELMREPVSALSGGPDGLAFYRRLAAEAPGVLRPGGAIAVEVGFGQAAAVRQILLAGGWRVCGIDPDLSFVPRVVWAVWPAP